MSSVLLPGQVVAIIRRIVNILSTFSISQQCIAGMDNNRSLGKVALDAILERPQPIPNTPLPNPLPKYPIPSPLDPLHQLLYNPALYEPIRVPRYPIVLCHGLYGFDARRHSGKRMRYWSNLLQILRDRIGAEVIVTSVPGTGSIASRAVTLDRQLQERALGRGVNFLAHSMGGLDCRHLISHVKPTSYAPLSLTTISTPHRGSPFMDWCAANLGLGKLSQHDNRGQLSAAAAGQARELFAEASLSTEPQRSSLAFSARSLATLPSSLTALIMSVLDSPAYANLTTAYLNNVFNPATPDDPNVKYFSVAGRMYGVNIWHPFWLPKLVMDSAEKKAPTPHIACGISDDWGNDGLVSVQSAKWGQFLGVMEGCDHWEMRGARRMEFNVDLPAFAAIRLGPSLGNSNAAAWEWLSRAWRKEEETRRHDGESHGPQANWISDADKQQAREDAVMESSTERLSTVRDWIVEQVPSPQLLAAKSKSASGSTASPANPVKERPTASRNELASKDDLERFYVALMRNLYDQGL